MSGCCHYLPYVRVIHDLVLEQHVKQIYLPIQLPWNSNQAVHLLSAIFKMCNRRFSSQLSKEVLEFELLDEQVVFRW